MNEPEKVEITYDSLMKKHEKEWETMPLYIGYKNIIKLGFKKDIVYAWFHRPDFPPMIKEDGLKVNKYKFRIWLEHLEVANNEC